MFTSHINRMLNGPLMAPVTTVPTINPAVSAGVKTGTSGDLSKQDIVDFLQDDEPEAEVIPLDDKKTKKETKDDEPEEEIVDDDEDEDDDEEETEEDDELADLENELEEPTEEQLKLTTPVRRKEILAKYPKLFKDFPYLETAYYREQQFTELLPTIEDAKQAVANSETLNNFEKDLTNGNTEIILKAVKASNPTAFAKIVDDYLPTLAKVDPEAYHIVIGNTIKHTIVAMVQEARNSDNEALQAAASVLNQFIFGKSEFTGVVKLSKDTPDAVDDATKKVAEREQALIQRQVDSAQEDLSSRVNNSIIATIQAHIDPKGSMTEYVKKNASREAMEDLQTLIEKDSRFKTIVDKLWEKAIQANFAKADTERIRSAYLTKAKTLLPSVIKKARGEALKGMGKRVVEKDNEQEETTQSTSREERRPTKKENEQPRSKSSGGKNKTIPKNMTSLEYLMSDD